VPVREIGDRAFEGRGLTSVTIPSSVRTIGYRAFADNQLTSVTLGHPSFSVRVGDYAFANNQLTSVSMTGVQRIGASAFAGNRLTSRPETGNATVAANAFRDNDFVSIEHIFHVRPIPNNSANHIEITWYTGPPGALTIPWEIGGRRVGRIGANAFRNRGITSVAFETDARNVNSVTVIGEGAFADNQISRVVFPGSLGTIEANAFANNRLTEVTISGGIGRIGTGAFANNQLRTVNFSRMPLLSDGAFENNQIANINNTSGQTIANIPAAFRGNPIVAIAAEQQRVAQAAQAQQQAQIRAAQQNPRPQSEFTVRQLANNTVEITAFSGAPGRVVIPQTLHGLAVSSIGFRAFRNRGVESVVIPATVTNIGEEAFYGNALAELVIPDSVAEIGAGAFRRNRLSSVTFGRGVRRIQGDAFSNNLLTSVSLPASAIGVTHAFRSNRITTVTVGNANTAAGVLGQIDGGAVFSGNNNLSRVTLPANMDTNNLRRFGFSMNLINAYLSQNSAAGTFVRGSAGLWTRQ
jgi:hypothetical protein